MDCEEKWVRSRREMGGTGEGFMFYNSQPCLYVHGNGPVGREKLVSQERGHNISS